MLPQRNRIVEQHLPQQLLPILRFKRRPLRKQFIERDTQRIHIGPMIHRNPLSHPLFRTHVPQCAEQVARHRQSLLTLNLSQPEVGDPQVVVVIDQQVRRLHIPMNDPHRVRITQRLRRLPTERRDVPTRPMRLAKQFVSQPQIVGSRRC